ncbi:MAG: hypothetical protein NTY61_01900 [Candidatus Parcubacteria bacterium]|nr:hypothetical protein [Candidatus Parcubacteria bacterium]
MATKGYKVCIALGGKLAPWRILSPDLGDIYNARKKNRRATLKVRLDDKPQMEQSIEISKVRIKKHEKRGGTCGAGYPVEEWFFSCDIWVEGLLVGGGHGKLYFEGGRLTGEITGMITIPPGVMCCLW